MTRNRNIKVRVREVAGTEGVPQWMAEVHNKCLSEWEAAIVREYFANPELHIEAGNVAIPVRRSP